MIKDVVEAYHILRKKDLRILRIIEAGHKRHEFVPQELVERWARYRREEVADSIRRLHYLGLLRRNRAAYLGWKITAWGYDVLAIHTLRAQRKVVRLSPTPIGVGKESVVYAGETPSGFKVAVKFHRGGVSAFRYEKAFRRIVKKFEHLQEVYETRLAAFAEFFALQKVFEEGGNVPEPIAHNRHVVVMAYIDGVELYKFQGDVKKIAEDVLNTLKTALRLGIIHGDLSPYNIIASTRGYVIDWPQWMPVGYDNWEQYLKRDIDNVARYFAKRGVELGWEELVNEARRGEIGRVFIDELKKQLT
ncbi:MAG: RIO1 family regulatory kinase/ATPase [Pyrobaculum sp.]